MSDEEARKIQRKLKAKKIDIALGAIKDACQEEGVRGSLTNLEAMSAAVIAKVLLRYLERD